MSARRVASPAAAAGSALLVSAEATTTSPAPVGEVLHAPHAHGIMSEREENRCGLQPAHPVPLSARAAAAAGAAAVSALVTNPLDVVKVRDPLHPAAPHAPCECAELAPRGADSHPGGCGGGADMGNRGFRISILYWIQNRQGSLFSSDPNFF